MKKLSEIIKEIEDQNGLSNYYSHNNYYTGRLELNIEFNNNITDKILKENKVREVEICAYWE